MLTQQQSTLETHHHTSVRIEDLVDAVNRLSNDDFNRLLRQTRRERQFSDDRRLANTEASEKQPVDTLTAREREVLTLVASGYSRKEIGEALAISGNTAACHIASIYRKLDIRTIAEATIIAISNKLI